MVWVALNPGQAGVACGFCGAFVGGVLRQLGAAPGSGGGTVCELGCGEAYCGHECRAAAAPCHHRLCVGPVEEDHPLYRFKLAAFSSGAFAQFTLAAKLAVMSAVAGSGSAGTSATVCCWQLSANKVPWWKLSALEVVGTSEIDKAQHRADAEEVATDCWQMLCDGVPLLHEDGASTRTATDWGRLLAYVTAEKVELSRPSLLEVACRQAWGAGGANSLSNEVAAGLLTVARAVLAARQDGDQDVSGGEEDWEEGDVDSCEEPQDGAASSQLPRVKAEVMGTVGSELSPPPSPLTCEASQLLLARLLADPASFFPRYEIAALYPTPRLAHSCAPTCREEIAAPSAAAADETACRGADTGLRRTIVVESWLGAPTGAFPCNP